MKCSRSADSSVETGGTPRILIIKPSSLGDVVHALPVLAALRRSYPRAHLAWLIGSSFASLLTGHPLLDELILFDRRRFGRMWQSPRILVEFARFAWNLRQQRFDLVLDLQGLFRSGLLAWLCGARRRVGFANAREFAWAFYTQRVRSRPDGTHRRGVGDQHAVDKNLALVRALGLEADEPAFPLGLRASELAAAAELLGTAGIAPNRFIALIPGARWESKRWPAERFATLIGLLARERQGGDGGRTTDCVLLGSPDDRTWAEQIAAAAGPGLVNLVGRTTLRELAAILALAELVICCDSGPMHIAAALDRPLVAIFGPTNPRRTGPYAKRARVVALPLSCAPCYRRHCPLGHHACLRELNEAAVLREVRELRRTPLSASADACKSRPGAEVPTR